MDNLSNLINNKIYILKNNDLSLENETYLEELEDEFESLLSRHEDLCKFNAKLDEFIAGIRFADMVEHYN